MSPTPAEQPNDNPLTHHQPYRQHVPGPNVENVRSSAQAKDITPYPKGGKR